MKKLFSAIFITFFFVVSCCSTSELPTQEDIAKTGKNLTEKDLDSLKRGRAIMLNNCSATFCHCLQPPNKHPLEKWEKVLPKMVKNAGLQESEKKELEFYIFTAVKTLPKQK